GLDSDAGLGGLTGCYTLASGETNDTVDAGFWRPAAIGDRVWLDANANGQQDAGEAGVAGVTVELYACIDGQPSGSALASTTTDAAGHYGFTGLVPGNYVVKFVTPTGYSLSPVDVGADGSDSDAALSGFTGCYTLASGETNNTVDAGLYQGAAIGDRVWEDTNANGRQDAGENGIAGATVRLYTCVDGVPGTLVSQTTTDASGNYAFTGLVPGQYIVAFETPAGYHLSTADVGADDGLDSDAGLGGLTGCYTLASGETNDTVDAGFWRPAAIGDRVWLDANANGQQDAGEAGVAGVAVELYACVDGQPGGGALAATTTDADGHYAFTGLKPGDYVVKFITPDGYSLSPVNVGADGTDSDAGLGGFTGCYTLVSGQTNNTVDAGLYPVALGIDVEKFTNGIDADNPTGPILLTGTTAKFTYEVRNTGTVALGAVALVDDNGTPTDTDDDFLPGFTGGDTDNDGLLDVGETWTYVATREVTAGQYVNLGTVTGTPVDGNGHPIPGLPRQTDMDPSHHFGADPRISIDKVTNGTDGGTYAVGSPITWTYTITNAGNVALSDIVVSDDQGVIPVYQSGDTDQDGLLDLTEAWIYEARGTAIAGDYSNLGTATGRFTDDAGSTRSTTDTDPSHYTGATPGIEIVKAATVAKAAPGAPVTYTYAVRSTGGLPLAGVVVTDDAGTPDYALDDFRPDYIGGDDGDALLEAGETWLYEATVTPPVGLTATIDGKTVDSGRILTQQLDNGDYRITFLQSRAINDNTYGSGSASDWSPSRPHRFSDLVNSDKAGFELQDGNGAVKLKFYMDYITASSSNLDGYTYYSGYQSLGVSGGDGSLLTGSAANLYDFDSSLELNLNRQGYTGMTVNSPTGDANWDATMAYSFTVKATAFGSAGLGGVSIFDQHNSPPKMGDNTLVPKVTGGEVTNVATATATASDGKVVSATDHATVLVTQGGSDQGTKFFVVDTGADDMFKYAANGGSNGDFMLQGGNTDPRDVAANADGSRLWVLDKDKSVSVYSGDGTAVGLWKADGLGKEPEGISLDGNDLWMADRDRKLYWYDNAATHTSGADSPEKIFTPSMSGSLKGIVTDGTYLWAVTEGGTDYVYRFKIVRDGAGDPSGLNASGVWKLATANAKPTGITLDPTGQSDSLWIVDEASDTVYEYGGARSLTSGTGSVSASFKLAAGNTAAQGIADPLSALPDTFDLADASAAQGLDAALADPYAGEFASALLDDAIAFHDVGLVGISTQSDAGLVLLHA
ncbi:MAG: carboxypeptidase regulatory-like domain-containing protein, partial [Thauera sp.]|nr:carboxypeptidase regulatory-like domain-containing protein [Thauera sp.]